MAMAETDSEPRFLRRWLNVYGPKPLAMAALFLLVMLVAGKYLYETHGPWNKLTVARLASGKGLELKHWIPYGLGWGSIAVLAVGAFILATARWWMRPTAPAMLPLPQVEMSLRGKWLYVGAMVLAVGLCGSQRAPRLQHSFWNDEEMAFRANVWGKYKVDEAGKLSFQPVSWTQTIYESEKGNNHVLASIVGRLGLALFNDPAKAAPAEVAGFQESAARMLLFFTSCLSVAALGWLGWVFGRPRAGLAAALLMSLHPWHIRYAVELRGYGSSYLFLILAVGCLVKALQSSGWRWWVLYGLAQALTLLAFLGTAYFFVVLNVVAFLILWRKSDLWRTHALRLALANGITLIPVAALLMPTLFQMLDYIKQPENRWIYPVPGLGWWQDFWHHLVLGFPETQARSIDGSGTSMEHVRQVHRWAGTVVYGIIPLLLLVGIYGLVRRDWRGSLIVIPTLLGAGWSVFSAAKSGNAMLPPYISYVLPLFCLALPWAAAWLPGRLANVLFAIVGVYLYFTQIPREVMKYAPRQPMRDAAQVARREGHTPTGDHASTITAVFGQSDDQIFTYDPRAIRIKGRSGDTGEAHLKELIQRAESTNVALLVYFCNLERAKRENPGVMTMLENPVDWQQEKLVKGVEDMWTYRIYLYLNGQ